HSINVEQGSPLRLTLLNLSTDKHLLLVSLPSLCADAWTLKNLVGEIGRSYAALLDNEELDGEPLQYADYAQWQNELLAGDDAEAGRDFWKEKNYSSLPNVTLPFEGRYR